MSLKKCAECGRQVSKTADTCPHCGAKNRRKGGGFWWVVLAAALAIMVGNALTTTKDDGSNQGEAKSVPAPNQAAKTQAKAEPQDTSADLAQAQAWHISMGAYERAKAQELQAYTECVMSVEDAARFDYKGDWLPDYTWSSDGKSISIVGRDIRLQNGFGAWSRVTYTCEWDMAAQKITNLNVLQ